MRKPKDPRELALAMMHRSRCSVQVGAVLADAHGIFSWGHNHEGFDGLGLCAERECVRRANRHRLKRATMYVAAQRKRNQKPLFACPCDRCRRVLVDMKVIFRTKQGEWLTIWL